MLFAETAPDPSTVEIDYIEVDMPRPERSGCSACDDVRTRLDAALGTVEQVLRAIGLRVKVRSLEVTTAAEAELLRLRGSPTVRIGGREIAPVHRGPAGEERVWHWRGEEHALPPEAMFTEALLDLANAREARQWNAYVLPDYIRRYVAAERAA